MSDEDSNLLTEIKELREHCLEQCEENDLTEKEIETALRECYDREPTYDRVQGGKLEVDAKYSAYNDILLKLDEIIREHKELDFESVKSTVESIKSDFECLRGFVVNKFDEMDKNNKNTFSKSAAWELVREEIVNAICLGKAFVTQVDSHFYGELEED